MIGLRVMREQAVFRNMSRPGRAAGLAGLFAVAVLALAAGGCERKTEDDEAPAAAPAPTAFPVDAEAWRARPDVMVRPSGLAIRVLRKSTGAGVPPGALVTVHYEGRFLDGRIFDSSIQRGQPARFPADRLIPGWVEALSLMHEGDRWELLIPPALAYGSRGAGSVIPPDTPLFFTVELIAVDAGAGAAPDS